MGGRKRLPILSRVITRGVRSMLFSLGSSQRLIPEPSFQRTPSAANASSNVTILAWRAGPLSLVVRPPESLADTFIRAAWYTRQPDTELPGQQVKTASPRSQGRRVYREEESVLLAGEEGPPAGMTRYTSHLGVESWHSTGAMGSAQP